MERGILVNKDLLKTELFKSPFLELINKELVDGDEIIIILLAGSRASGLSTPNSDIDLAVRTIKSWNLRSTIKGEFQGNHLHWWISPIIAGEIAWTDPNYLGLILTGHYFMNYSSENIIYINPKYESLIQYLREHQNIIKITALYHLVLYLNNEIQLWTKENTFKYSKLMLPLADFYYEKNQLTKNTDLLIKLKKAIRDSSVKITNKEWEEFSKALFWTLDYTKKNIFPVVEYLEYYKGLTEELDKCNKNLK